jgi:hypothetical protein
MSAYDTDVIPSSLLRMSSQTFTSSTSRALRTLAHAQSTRTLLWGRPRNSHTFSARRCWRLRRRQESTLLRRERHILNIGF